jgi:hypothetical protein
MGPLDALGHLLGLFLPALGTAAIAAALAKGLWRSELSRTSWWRLTLWPAAAGSLALLGGLVLMGRDGRMATYGAMLLSCTLALWWAGWGPARR